VNHKRGRPKNRRAGCLLCKPHKANGAPEGGEKHVRAVLIKLAKLQCRIWKNGYPDGPEDDC